MKLGLIILGIIVVLVGVLCYYLSSASWTLWGIIPIPNPFAYLKPYNIYVMIGGGVLFLIGLVTGRK